MTGPADVHVTRPVEPGSLVVLPAAYVPAREESEVMDTIVAAVMVAAGHRQFAVLWIGDGAVEVWGPDVDLVQKVREALAERTSERGDDDGRGVDRA